MTRQRNFEVAEAFTSYKVPDRKCRSVRCKWCQKELAQHSGRQQSHLRLCRPYQRHLREQGIAPSEGRQVVHLGSGKSNSPNTEMGYEKSSSSPLLATAAVDGMHESAVPVSTRTRSGECKFKIRSEKASVGCPCQVGEFDIPESVSGWVDIRCNNCAHLIGSHGGFPKDSEATRAGGATPVGDAADLTRAENQSPTNVLVTLRLQSSPRRHSVSALWEQQQLHRVIQICGPPSSGKSTLASLLVSHVSRNSDSTEICSIVCPSLPQLPPHSHWISVLHSIGVPGHFLESHGPRLLILDDAQNLCQFRNFWNDFIKRETTEGTRNLCISLFSSYSDETMYLSPKQTVSCRPLPTNNPSVSLYLAWEEYGEILTTICETRKAEALVLSGEVKEFLYSLTSGHPGCLFGLVNAVKEAHASKPPTGANLRIMPPVMPAVCACDPAEFSNFLKTSAMQTLFPPSLLSLFEQSPISKTMQQVVARQSVTGNSENTATLENCCRIGLLVSEVDPTANTWTYTTPSLLHRRVYEHVLSRIFPAANPSPNVTLLGFITVALRHFSRRSLGHHRSGLLGPGLITRPSSSLYYDELYRTCWDLTPVIECEKTGGKLELWFPEIQWAVRDKHSVNAHGVKEQIWLEFGNVVPKDLEGFSVLPSESLYHIVFGENHSTCEILDSRLKRIDKFELMP